MKDTQWPRFQVFLQEKPGEPHQDVGSVHAPDAELALFNARDVFVRRPECASLWVVPAGEIFSKTAQELARWNPPPGSKGVSEGSLEPYYVFNKQRSAGTQTLVGVVEAASPEEALQLGVTRFSGQKPPFAWWVFPAGRITASDPQDTASLFSPALDKPFRLSTDFHTVSAMREIRQRQEREARDAG